MISWPPTRACSWRSRAATPCCGGGLVVVATGWELGISEAPDTATAVVAAAFDLHDRASDVAPEAVEHLLIDVLDEAGLSEEQVTIDAMARRAVSFN